MCVYLCVCVWRGVDVYVISINFATYHRDKFREIFQEIYPGYKYLFKRHSLDWNQAFCQKKVEKGLYFP